MNKKKNPIYYSKDVLIAIVALASIAAYLFLRFIFVVPTNLQNVPLYIALIIGGTPLIFNLLIKFIHLQFSSDLLAGLSIVTAVFLGQYLAGTIIVLMLSGGQALEAYAVRRASFLLEALAKRMPNFAHRKEKETVSTIPADQIEIGNILVIYPHEICPVDGRVVEGHGIMDESYLTGEPFLISKTPGSNVLSGALWMGWDYRSWEWHLPLSDTFLL